MISGVLATVFYARERQAKAEADFHSERARVAVAERSTKAAELKLLQAQVEPHFLYNTLANVISLVDGNPVLAKRMLERLVDYLRSAALAVMEAEATLGQQIELLRAYLDVIALRMGSRLSYRIDVPADLVALTLPPMLLQPLVENAIKHGVEPATRGGEVIVSARREADRLLLTVEDDGCD
jgi:sensor histidine kinase YesM